MKPKILFLCTGNSCRSQMAEGWCRHFWKDRWDCESAGTQKHGMNPRAVKVMQEAGIDLTSHYSKTTDDLQNKEFDWVITVCDSAHEACPYFPGAQVIHVGFEDPPRLTAKMNDEEQILTVYRRVRDQIRDAIQNLPDKLDRPIKG